MGHVRQWGKKKGVLRERRHGKKALGVRIFSRNRGGGGGGGPYEGRRPAGRAKEKGTSSTRSGNVSITLGVRNKLGTESDHHRCSLFRGRGSPGEVLESRCGRKGRLELVEGEGRRQRGGASDTPPGKTLLNVLRGSRLRQEGRGNPLDVKTPFLQEPAGILGGGGMSTKRLPTRTSGREKNRRRALYLRKEEWRGEKVRSQGVQEGRAKSPTRRLRECSSKKNGTRKMDHCPQDLKRDSYMNLKLNLPGEKHPCFVRKRNKRPRGKPSSPGKKKRLLSPKKEEAPF